jgi:hypothetical protein
MRRPPRGGFLSAPPGARLCWHASPLASRRLWDSNGGRTCPLVALRQSCAGFTVPQKVARQKNCLVAAHADVMLRGTL